MIKQAVQDFMTQYKFGVIVNEAQGSALLFISPEFEELADNKTMIKFESLSEDHGSSVIISEILDSASDSLTLGTEDNTLTIRPLNLATYKIYIAANYFNAKEYSTEKELFEAIEKQLKG